MEAHLAEHFDDAEQQYTAAELGMWVFLATEVLFFGGMFTGYAVYRGYYSQAFSEGSHTLDLVLGTINTGILLGSSLTMALSVHAAQSQAADNPLSHCDADLGGRVPGHQGVRIPPQDRGEPFPRRSF